MAVGVWYIMGPLMGGIFGFGILPLIGFFRPSSGATAIIYVNRLDGRAGSTPQNEAATRRTPRGTKPMFLSAAVFTMTLPFSLLQDRIHPFFISAAATVIVVYAWIAFTLEPLVADAPPPKANSWLSALARHPLGHMLVVQIAAPVLSAPFCILLNLLGHDPWWSGLPILLPSLGYIFGIVSFTFWEQRYGTPARRTREMRRNARQPT